VERPSDLENCLAAFVSSDGSLNMVVGRGRTQVDYELALLGALGRIGTNTEVCVDANERTRLDGPLP
jgi:hypothetical protein